MEILIDDIPEEGFELKAHAGDDPWFFAVMAQVFPETFETTDSAHLRLFCYKLGRNVDVSGNLVYSLHPTCDRCLEHFHSPHNLPLHTYLSPLARISKGKHEEDEDVVRDDVEFSYYEGDRFDLADIIREQLELHRPMKWLCSESCLGLCQYCGKNLNDGSCKCESSGA